MAYSNDHPLVAKLWPLGPEAEPSARLNATFRAYEQATGQPVGDNPSRDHRRQIRDWLMEQEMGEDGVSISLLFQKVGVARPLVHMDTASKSNWLRQGECSTCLPDAESPASHVYFGVRVRPFSAQAMNSEDLAQLKDKISASMEGRLKFSGDWSDASVCVTVVAVVPTSDRLKDVDNMVKGLLDSLQGHIYVNDRQISHLSVHRLHHDGDEGHYLLSAQPVRSPLDDVVDLELRLGWPGQDEIRLD